MQKISCHKNNFDEKLLEVKQWNISDKEKTKIKEFFKDYEIGKITGRICSKMSLLRYLYFLKVGIENFKEENLKGTEDFLNRLLKDKIYYKTITKEGEETKHLYPIRSKREILQVLARYLDWKKEGNNYTKILKIKFTNKKPDIETLNEEEVNLLFEKADNIQRKFLIAVLNSSGMRAEEFHNVRYSDIVIPKGDEKFIKITIRNQFSKTKGRTISLYEKNVLKVVKDYLNYRIAEGIKPEEPVFKISYNTSRKWLKHHGKKILDRNVYYHLFRHTSATRLSSKMNRQQLCIYFGWDFSSHMPDIYIKRAGVNMEDVTNHFSNTRMEDLEERFRLKDEELQEIKLLYDKVIKHLGIEIK